MGETIKLILAGVIVFVVVTMLRRKPDGTDQPIYQFGDILAGGPQNVTPGLGTTEIWLQELNRLTRQTTIAFQQAICQTLGNPANLSVVASAADGRDIWACSTYDAAEGTIRERYRFTLDRVGGQPSYTASVE